MVKVREKIALVPSVWDEEVNTYLQRVWKKGNQGFIIDVRREVEAKKASLFKAVYQSKVVGCVIIRVEQFSESKELVMVAASGRVQDGSLLDTFLPELPKIAKINGCNCIRMHTDSKAIMRMYEKHDYIESERVYKKEL